MNIKEIIDSGILEQYVLGDLDENGVLQVESYLKLFPELKDHMFKLEESVLRMSQENAIEPPDGSKAFILNEINNLQSQSTLDFSAPYKFWKKIASLAVAIASILLVVGAYFYSQQNELKEKFDTLSEEYVKLSEACNQERKSNNGNKEMLIFMQNPETRLIAMEPVLQSTDKVYAYWN